METGLCSPATLCWFVVFSKPLIQSASLQAVTYISTTVSFSLLGCCWAQGSHLSFSLLKDVSLLQELPHLLPRLNTAKAELLALVSNGGRERQHPAEDVFLQVGWDTLEKYLSFLIKLLWVTKCQVAKWEEHNIVWVISLTNCLNKGLLPDSSSVYSCLSPLDGDAWGAQPASWVGGRLAIVAWLKAVLHVYLLFPCH